MSTKPLLHKLAMKLALYCLAWLTLLLVACGPGTGGTGTGPMDGTPTSTTAPGVYSGVFTVTPSANPATPTGCTSCTATQAVSLQVQTDSIKVSSPCFTFTYAGLWSAAADGSVMVQGSYTQLSATAPSGTLSQPATLTLRFGVGNNSVQLSIQDAAGQTLLLPTTLQRVAPPLVLSVPGIC
jgi:hypothetical protein